MKASEQFEGLRAVMRSHLDQAKHADRVARHLLFLDVQDVLYFAYHNPGAVRVVEGGEA